MNDDDDEDDDADNEDTDDESSLMLPILMMLGMRRSVVFRGVNILEHLCCKAVQVLPGKGEGLGHHIGQSTLLCSLRNKVQALTIPGQEIF